MATARELPVGSRVGAYEIRGLLGRGGSAVVYRARREGRDCALKVRIRGDPELDARFLREVRALRDIRLPGVIRLLDAGRTDDLLWFAMELVEGEPIGVRIARIADLGARCRVAAMLGARLCRILADIHRHGLVHRDLKPTNVLVDADDAVHVLDFGVVHRDHATSTLTGEGRVVGTLAYMAPEQIAGLAVTGAADVFAVAVILHESVAGRRTRPRRVQEWFSRQILDRLPSLCTIGPEVPRALSATIDAMLSFDPADRPSAAAAAAALEDAALLDWPEPPKFVGRRGPLADLVRFVEGRTSGRVAVLVGAAGSGRRRLVEQVRRQALLTGIVSIVGRCALDAPGAAVFAVVRGALAHHRSGAQGAVTADDAATLGQIWPELVPRLPGGEPDRSLQGVALAAARTVARVSRTCPLMVVLTDIDQVDSLTSRFVTALMGALAEETEALVRLVLVMDDRWANDRAHTLVARLSPDALRPDLDRFEPEEVAEVVRQFGPPRGDEEAMWPWQAVERGLQGLACARGEALPVVPAVAFPLAFAEGPLPRAVVAALGVEVERGIREGWLVECGDRVGLAGTTLCRWVQALVPARRRAEDRLANAIAQAWREPAAAASLARHRLAGTRPLTAHQPALQAALHAVSTGRWGEARRWLLVLDLLRTGPDASAQEADRFSRAWCRARVALAIEVRPWREDLVAQAERRAKSASARAAARLLRFELQARQGDVEQALGRAIRFAGRKVEEASVGRCDPAVGAEALALCAALHLAVAEPVQAVLAAERAERVRGGRRADLLQVRLDRYRAAAWTARGDAVEARRTAEAGLDLALRLDATPEAAALRLYRAVALYRQGDRRTAETEAWRAHAELAGPGWRSARAEVSLLLARIALGRGDPAAARRLLADAHEAREGAARFDGTGGAGIDIERAALELELVVSCESAAAIRHALATSRVDDPSAGVEGEMAWRWAVARAWRVLRRPDRALAGPPPADDGFGSVRLAIELARAWIDRGDRREAAMLAGRARAGAARGGFRDLEDLAALVAGAIEPCSESEWRGLFERCRASDDVELSLSAIEMDGRRRLAAGDRKGAHRRSQELARRSQELGVRSGAARLRKRR